MTEKEHFLHWTRFGLPVGPACALAMRISSLRRARDLAVCRIMDEADERLRDILAEAIARHWVKRRS